MVLELLILGSLGVATTLSIMLTTSSSARKKILSAIRRKPPYTVDGNLVSVVVPTLNEEYYLPRCLKSIKNQTYQNTEIIVADSDSTDRTVDIGEEFGTSVVDAPKNISAARNTGAEKANGKFLLFLDADCILEQCYIEKMVEVLSKNTILAHGGQCIYDHKMHNFIWTLNRWFKPYFYTSGRGVCIGKREFWKIGGYDVKLDPMEGKREDLDLGIRILKEFGPFSIRYRPTVLVGTSARREKVFGYPLLKIPKAWEVRGIRKGKIIQ